MPWSFSCKLIKILIRRSDYYPINGLSRYYRDQTKGGGFDRSHQWCVTVVATNQAPARDHGIVALSRDKKLDIEVWGTCRLSKAGQNRFVQDGNSVFLSV